MENYELYESTLKNSFHLSYLKPYQELIISRIIEAKGGEEQLRMLACLPTGEGKSLCFMLPSALFNDYMIIIYPLLSLMNDQAKRFESAGISTEILKGGMEAEERRDALERLRNRKSHVLITNIEMLLILIKTDRIGFMRGQELTVVLDEAHTIITWGGSFRQSYRETGSALSYLRPGIILAFTATMDNGIRDGLISSVFSDKRPLIIHASCDRPNIFYSSVLSLSKKWDICSILKDKRMRPAVVFTKSRKEAEELQPFLSKYYDAMYYHAGLTKEEKKKRENWFYSSSDGVMIATIAFGMGVDKAGIRTVIHTYIPSSPSAYIQEAGRGGRDGGVCCSVVLRYENEDSPMKHIFSGKGCIRTGLLRMMNETAEYDRCLSCSPCIGTLFFPAGEKELLLYIRKHIFGRAADTAQRIYGRRLLPGWNCNDISYALKQLLAQNKITQKLHRYRLTEKGKESLKAIRNENLIHPLSQT